MPRQKYIVPLKLNYEQADGTQNVFIRGKELGRGSFSVVYHVIHQSTDKSYAMKVVSKREYLKNKIAYEGMKNEIKIQTTVKHPNVVSSHYSFSDKHNYYFILEYCPGRTIREYLSKSPNYRLKEPEARKIIKDVVQGLSYIHSHGITHYDIKLENFVIDLNGNVKIGDFGLSTFHKSEEGKKFEIFGTVNYISPEMLFREKREDTTKCDIWAIGISAFYLLTGDGPFEGRTKEITFKNIRKGEFHFPYNIQISKEAKDFILKILQRDPHKRPSAKELLNHPFLTKIDKETVNLYRQNAPPIFNKSSQKVPQTDINLCTETETNTNLKTVFNQPRNEIQTVSPKKVNDNRKNVLCPGLNGETSIVPKKANDLRMPVCCTSLDDTSPKKFNVNQKQVSPPPQKEKEAVLPKKVDDVKKPVCPPPKKEKESALPKKVDDVKKPVCPPPQKEKEAVLPKKTDDDKKPVCLPPKKEKETVLPKKVDDVKKPLCTFEQIKKEKEAILPKKADDDKKPVCPPPKKEKETVLPKKSDDDKKPLCTFEQIKKEKESALPKKADDDKKPLCTFEQIKKEKEAVLPKKADDDKKPVCPPPQKEKETVSPKKVNDVKKAVCPPKRAKKAGISPRKAIKCKKPVCRPVQDDDETVSPKKVNEDKKPVCSPQKEKETISPRKVNDDHKPPCCPPLNKDKPNPPKKSDDHLEPLCCPPLNDIKRVCLPSQNDVKPISPRIYILPNTKTPFSPLNENNSTKQSAVKNFQIPNHFVSRFCFYNDDLGYLLVDGTVGICFKDKSRIVLDPTEQFVQFYKTPRTKFPDVTELKNVDEESETNSISLVKKVAKNFKKIRFSYDLPTCEYDPSVLLHNINCYVKNEDSIMFKMDDRNLQVVFDDHMKLIIFWNSKKMCFFKSIREKCCLLDLKSISSFGSNSEELRKFKNAKLLLSDLALTIC